MFTLARCLIFLSLMLLTFPVSATDSPLSGTQQLGKLPEDIVQTQLQEVFTYFKGRIKQAEVDRPKLWKLDTSSPDAYQKSLKPHRDNLHKMLGTINGDRKPTVISSDVISKKSDLRVERLTLSITPGLIARGLLFTPLTPKVIGKRPAIIICPDADTWPEKFTGIGEGETISGGKVFGSWLRNLMERGVVVYVPQFIERLQDYPYCKQTKNKDRRFILYRLGFTVGHSMPALDVADVLAAVGYLSNSKDIDATRIGIVGAKQGAMTAQFAAALDTRIAAVALVDYFENRNDCWSEPVDRRIRDRLLEFGDAELAAMIAPRKLRIISSLRFQMEKGGFEEHLKRGEVNGREFQRLAKFYTALKARGNLNYSSAKSLISGFEYAIGETANLLGTEFRFGKIFTDSELISKEAALNTRNTHFEERMAYLRKLLEKSEKKRYDRWGILDAPASEFKTIREKMLADYRKLVGKVPNDGTPLNPQTRLVETHEKYKTYRVMLDVVKGVHVYGNLLVPTNIKGTRPAVIAQHGLNGTPEMITGLEMKEDTVYHEFGRKLAENGYVVFAPLILHHNPVAQITDQVRQAGVVGMMRIAMPIAKNERVLDFLQSLPFVYGSRIGYYGLSYGGYSAIWMAPLLSRLKVSVISGHFNDWRTKIVSDQLATSFLLHPAEDMYNWDILNRFTHPELIVMALPIPSCIEFGTRDGITTPEWTAYGWKQTKQFRDHLNLGNKIILAEFDGKHEVKGEEAFDFVDRYLCPRRKNARD